MSCSRFPVHPEVAFLHSAPPQRLPTALPLHWISRRNGLPSGQVHGLCQDLEGLLWLAGPSGLIRWDGARTQVYTKAQGLRTQGLRSLACAPDGPLWVGSDLGVDLLEQLGPDTVRIRPLSGPDWPHGWVSQIVFGAPGEVWLACARGLLRWTEAEGFVRQTGQGLGDSLIGALLVEPAGRVWAAGPHIGLLRRDGQDFQAPEHDDWRQVGQISCLGRSAAGQLLVGGSAGLMAVDPRGVGVGPSLHWPGEPVTALLSSGPDLWVGSAAGLRRHRAEESAWTSVGACLADTAINALLHDRQGNLWVATDQNGVAKLSGLRAGITPLVPGGGLLSVRNAPGGAVWLGGTRTSWAYDPHSGQARELAGLDHLQVWDLLEHGGEVWAATQQGLYWQRQGEFMPYGPAQPELAQPCRAFLGRPDGLWVATVHGLYALCPGADPELREMVGDGRSLGYVYTLEHDAQGRALVGTLGRGAWREAGGGGPSGVAPSGQLEALSGGALLPGGHVYALAPHPDGRLAVLQDHQTLLLDPAGHASVLDQTDQGVAGWAADWAGDQLRVGSSMGLRLYDLGQDLTPDGPQGPQRREIRAWIGADAWEFTTSRSLLSLPDGRLLCGVNSGGVLLDLPALARLPALPPVRCSGLRWSGGAPDPGDGPVLSIAPGRWSLEVDLACAWFLDEDDLRFRHRLLGFEREWSAWSQEATLHFTSLPPGEYSLDVQAQSSLTPAGPASRLLTLQVRSASPATRLGRAWSALISGRANRRLLDQNLVLEQRVRARTLDAERAHAELLRVNAELLALSSTDPLTGLANRRAFDDALQREVRRAARQQTSLAVALLDIDAFKQYNDALGHLQGDTCLQWVAQIVQRAVRLDQDLVARFGGEEFVLILPDTDTEGALQVVERVRAALTEADIPHPASGVAPRVTLSAGVAGLDPDQLTGPDDLLHHADEALYRAKRTGRDRAVAHRPDVVAAPPERPL